MTDTRGDTALDAMTLDVAWADAEAALPPNWYGPSVGSNGSRGGWWALACDRDGGCEQADGATPADALRALAAFLRAVR